MVVAAEMAADSLLPSCQPELLKDHTMNENGASPINDFEQQVWQGTNETALDSLLRLMGTLSASGGRLGNIPGKEFQPAFQTQRAEEIATRIAGAAVELFSRQDCIIDEKRLLRFMVLHRWLALVFNASSFGNTDFILKRLGFEPTPEFLMTAQPDELFKLSILYGAESSLPINFSAFFKRAPKLATSLAIAILSNRLLTTQSAHQKRELLLRWITEALGKLDNIAALPVEILVDLWMHSSYGLEKDKHNVKRPLNKLLRRHMNDFGIVDPQLKPRASSSRPTIFVMLEWFHKRHSIMRTHSISMNALREHYHMVGFGPKGMVDAAGKELFDEFHVLEPYSPDLRFMKPVLKLVEEHRPVATYFPSVGMALHSLYLVNIRLAPTQVIALGHPATTHSDKIDHVVVEEDYVGDVSLFSENVTQVPKNALPYFEPTVQLPKSARKAGGPVRIAVPAAIMKLNPLFLETCRAIQQQARHEVEFHFLLGGAPELVHSYAQKAIAQFLSGAIVHETTAYEHYMANIAMCDMFANPFPFGNTNGIVDTVFCGLPGICFTGDEVHSHIDEGMFRRMNFPQWTIAATPQDYISAALRMIDDPALRDQMSADICKQRPDKTLYVGNPVAFSDVFRELVDTRSISSPMRSVSS